MKLVAAFFLTIIISISSVRSGILRKEQHDELESYKRQCLKESGLKAVPEGKVGENPELDKHLLCLVKKTGMMGKDGKPIKDLVEWEVDDVIHDKDKAAKATAACVSQKSSPLNTVVDGYQCLESKTGLDLLEIEH